MKTQDIYLLFGYLIKRINIKNVSNFLCYKIINSNNIKISNKIEHLSFQLKTYNESMPIFQVILDFFTGIGGVY